MLCFATAGTERQSTDIKNVKTNMAQHVHDKIHQQLTITSDLKSCKPVKDRPGARYVENFADKRLYVSILRLCRFKFYAAQ